MAVKLKFKNAINTKSLMGIGSTVSNRINIRKRNLFIISVVVFCLIFFIAFLYQPAKNYYISVRENDKLQLQYELLCKNNEELSDDIEFLQTEDGIKQKATDSLGLIEQGESIGYVAGTDIEDGRTNLSSSTSSKISFKNVKSPTTWYSPIFNFIFNVSD